MKYLTLCENHLFQKTFNGGKKHHCSTVTVFVLKDKKAALIKKRNPEKKKLNRVGIILSGKFGNAVERNRAKRLVREGYRLILSEYTVSEGWLIVILPSRRIKNVGMQKVRNDLFCCLDALKMIRMPETEAREEVNDN